MASSNGNNNFKSDKIKILICTSNLGNAQPTKTCIESLIPYDGVIDTDSPYPLPNLSDSKIFNEEVGSPFTSAKLLMKEKSSSSEEIVVEELRGSGIGDSVDGDQFDIIAIGMQEATFSQGRDEKQQKQLIESGESNANGKALNLGDNIVNECLRRSTEVMSFGASSVQNQMMSFTTLGNKAVKLGIKAVALTTKTVDGISNQIYESTDKMLSPFHAVGADANHLDTHDLFDHPATLFGGTREIHTLIMDQCPSYQCVTHYQRGEMRLMILILKSKLQHLASIECVAGNTGIGKFLPNKGGIVAHLTMYDTRLSFITAHLAAHEGSNFYTNRCDNMRQILSQAKFSTKYPNAYDASILSHYAFVFGDLNFRIQIPLETQNHEEHVDSVLKLVEKKDWITLSIYDELLKAIQIGDFCTGFRTLPCHFPPTFKLERSDGFQYKSQRTPSYTDRILWKTAHGLSSNVMPLYYEPCSLCSSSDHKPVRGAFSISCHNKASSSQQHKQQIPTMFSEPMECHFFITDMSCTSLNITSIEYKRTMKSEIYSTYITFLTSPIELLPNIKKDTISLDKFRSCPKTSKNKIDPINPQWNDNKNNNDDDDDDDEQEEVHFITTPSLCPQFAFKNSFLYISAVHSLPAQDDYLIGTCAIDLYQLLLQNKIYNAFDKKEFQWEEFYMNTLPPSIEMINCPLKKNGLTCGYLNCKIVMGWYFADEYKRKTLLKSRTDIKRDSQSKNMNPFHRMHAFTKKFVGVRSNTD